MNIRHVYIAKHTSSYISFHYLQGEQGRPGATGQAGPPGPVVRVLSKCHY